MKFWIIKWRSLLQARSLKISCSFHTSNKFGFLLLEYVERGSRFSVGEGGTKPYIYRPQTKLRKGNVFYTCLCFCSRRGGVQPPPQADTPPPSRRPLQRTVRILLECILVCQFFRNSKMKLRKLIDMSSYCKNVEILK